MIDGITPWRTEARVAAADLPAMMTAKPAAKRWRVLRLFACDWAHNPQASH